MIDLQLLRRQPEGRGQEHAPGNPRQPWISWLRHVLGALHNLFLITRIDHIEELHEPVEQIQDVPLPERMLIRLGSIDLCLLLGIQLAPRIVRLGQAQLRPAQSVKTSRDLQVLADDESDRLLITLGRLAQLAFGLEDPVGILQVLQEARVDDPLHQLQHPPASQSLSGDHRSGVSVALWNFGRWQRGQGVWRPRYGRAFYHPQPIWRDFSGSTHFCRGLEFLDVWPRSQARCTWCTIGLFDCC